MSAKICPNIVQPVAGQSQLVSVGVYHHAPGEYQPVSLMMVQQVPSPQGGEKILVLKVWVPK